MGEITNLVKQSMEPLITIPMDRYMQMLADAEEAYPPVYGRASYGAEYRQKARNIDWFVTSLVTNAEREGFGSRQIWRFSQIIARPDMAKLVRGHSIDESRHSRMFVKLLDLCVPGGITPAVRADLFALSPGYTANSPYYPPSEISNVLNDDQLIDELIQINLVEIRSLILQRLLRPVVMAYYSGQQSQKIVRMLDILLQDECKHIEYSARCIEALVGHCGTDLARNTFVQRQHDLNEVTSREMDVGDYE
jgi:hypothetical protein